MQTVAGYLGVTLFCLAMLKVAVNDLGTMTIRNSLILGLLGAYCFLAPLAGLSRDVVIWSAMAGCVVLAFAFFLFVRGWIGGGDAKLASVTVLWLGADQAFPYLLYTAIAGGALTLLLLQFRRWPLRSAHGGAEWIRRLHRRDTGVPYGVAMAIAALILLPRSPWIAGLL